MSDSLLASVDSFLRYFDGVNKRAMRDIAMLPADAETWTPPAGAGEDAWSIGQIVAHMAASRLLFARAYCGDGWTAEVWSPPAATRDEWQAALQSSADGFHKRLEGTPDAWLTRKVEPLNPKDFPSSGWRLLLAMTEHDIHHRSQIDTYAGVMGWPVAHIFGLSAEEAGLAPPRSVQPNQDGR
jgi:uncharacterized damage-inducible protein DinB